MAIADLSFKLYTDAGLTTPFSNIFQLVHQTNLSDNPQDFQLWFGSPLANRVLETTANAGVDNIVLTPTDTLPDWMASTVYALGDRVEPTTPNGFVYEATVAGTSGATEPPFPTGGIGSTVTDNGITWRLYSDRHQITEMKLASTAAGLPGATGGAALSLGTTINSGVANAVEINVRFTNQVDNVSDSTGYEEIALFINDVTESA